MEPHPERRLEEKAPVRETILRLSGITMLYPGTVALNNVSFDVRAGECHGIIGKNGAGKTTLMKIISGIVKQTQGRIFLHDREIGSLSRRQSKEAGISIVTQEPQVIPDFTVAENLYFPDYLMKSARRIAWRDIAQKAEEVVDRAGFHLNVQAKGSDLSISEQQLLLVLKAFYVDENRIVILDEVTAALTQKDQEFLFQVIGRETGRGKAVLFISHRLGEIVRICDRVTVLRDGRKIITENMAALDEQKLSGLIVGEDYTADLACAEGRSARGSSSGDGALLSVRSLTNGGMFHDVSFDLYPGEILGLAGLRGSGRTEVMKTIVGLFRPDDGEIILDGQKVRPSNPAWALRKGIVYLPEDRDMEGLIEILSVRFNLSLSSIWKFTRNGIIKKDWEQESASDLVSRLCIQTAGLEQEVRSLSGGNRQKVVVGRLMAASPRVYLLDEPTKGVDIGAKKTILGLVRDLLVKEGSGVILTSPGLEDLLAVCDRILVLFEGRVAGEFGPAEFNQARIYAAMQGLDNCRAPEENPGRNRA
ncbi:MAG: sugar ABC transporter ATP-binding protein [Thermodesulfobacteriota bacterium]